MSAAELLERLRPRRAPAPAPVRAPRSSVRLDAPAAARSRLRALLASKRARRLTLLGILLLALLGGAWLWVRDSSLVSVEHVTVTGDSGPDAAQIRSALVSAARTMSTLDVHIDRLRTAVAPYPVVRDVRVSTDFPHGLRIQVIEQIPVATIVVGGRSVPVAADGTLLHDAGSTPPLPVLQLRSVPGGARLSDPEAMSEVALLAAAPYPLLAKISQLSQVGVHGLTAQLRNGPAIYFGDASQPAAKWRAVVAVLADPGSAGATYIDVTDPRHPAAGSGTAAVAAAGVGGGASTGAASSGSSSAPTAASSGSASTPSTSTASGATGGATSGAAAGSSGTSTGTVSGTTGAGGTTAAAGSSGTSGTGP
jgi:cell division protein FtsQ